MSLQDVIRGVKLKPGKLDPEAARLRSRREYVQTLPVFYSTDDEYRRLAQQCDISNWLDALAHVSFRSVCVPLSPEAIGAIIQGHHSVQAGECVDDAISLPALKHLGLLIERAMVELGCRECFVRLDTRSMKDVPILESELFRECVERCEAEMRHPVDAGSKPNRINLRMRACSQAMIEMLAVTDARAALKLMVKSVRVQDDLLHAQRQCELDSEYTYNLMVREFIRFPVELETRAFVFDGRLTAITQYNRFTYVPAFSQYEQQLTQATLRLVNEDVIPSLDRTALKSFVLDLVNMPTEQGEFEIHVVELNPFFEATGGCLFEWNLDKPVLMGIEPFEFRYNKSVLQSFNMHYLEDDLRSFVEEIM